jgi:hypothetical protein
MMRLLSATIAALFLTLGPALAQSVLPVVQGVNPVETTPTAEVDTSGVLLGAPNRSVSVATLTALGAGTVNTADFTNPRSRGLQLIIDITAITGTPTLTVTIQGKDPVSGKYYALLVSTALNAVATTVLRVYPGLTASNNLVASDIVPSTWRVSYVVAGGTPVVTAKIAAQLVD